MAAGLGRRLADATLAWPCLPQVAGCGKWLWDEKIYCQRNRVCKYHLSLPELLVDNVPSRFCSQCSRFHPLHLFDSDRRSCRERLAAHTTQRRLARKAARQQQESSPPSSSHGAAADGVSDAGTASAFAPHTALQSTVPMPAVPAAAGSDGSVAYLVTSSALPSNVNEPTVQVVIGKQTVAARLVTEEQFNSYVANAAASMLTQSLGGHPAMHNTSSTTSASLDSGQAALQQASALAALSSSSGMSAMLPLLSLQQQQQATANAAPGAGQSSLPPSAGFQAAAAAARACMANSTGVCL